MSSAPDFTTMPLPERLGRSFLLIRIVLDLVVRSWMKVPGGASDAPRRRQAITCLPIGKAGGFA